MSWTIYNIENSVKIPKEIIPELQKKLSELFHIDEDTVNEVYFEDNKLVLLEDDMEHMNYIPYIKDSLVKHKVKGIIAFASFEGDNKNKLWGYKFQNGNCDILQGKIVWSIKNVK